MLAVRLPENVEQKLGVLAKATGRSKSYYARQAIMTFLEDREDYLLALSRLEAKNPRLTLEELERRLDLDNSI